jgi:hypothetical protein
MNLAHIVILARESSTMEAWTLPTGLLGKILDSVIRLVGRVQGITTLLSVRSKVASVRSKQKITHLWITSVGRVQATRGGPLPYRSPNGCLPFSLSHRSIASPRIACSVVSRSFATPFNVRASSGLK